jgi:hypothetical protein
MNIQISQRGDVFLHQHNPKLGENMEKLCTRFSSSGI